MEGTGEPQASVSLRGALNGLQKSSSTASSLPSSTPRSLSEGKESTATLKCLAVTLLYSYTNGKKIIFLEAGKDFVDILLSLLLLPLGGIVKLLYRGSDLTRLDRPILKVFNSVKKMEDDKLYTSKKSLLDPNATTSGFGSKLLQADSEEKMRPSSAGVYYSCGMVPHCVCITKELGQRCPRHGRKMQTLCRFVDKTQERVKSKPDSETGYVKEGSKFFITDNLEIFPTSKCLRLLQKLHVDRMSLLSSLDMFVGMDEVHLSTPKYHRASCVLSPLKCQELRLQSNPSQALPSSLSEGLGSMGG